MADRGESERDQFTALYDEHYAAVLRYAARRVGAEAARDIAAETFLTAWRRLDRRLRISTRGDLVSAATGGHSARSRWDAGISPGA